MAWRSTIHCLLAVLALTGADALGDVPSRDSGRILCAYWRELPGGSITDLTSNAAYPNFPDEQVYLDRFEIPENQEANFGTVVHGFVRPPQNGDYTFYIAGNSQCELWLSDGSDPALIRLIASVPEWSLPRDWSANPQQQSKPIHLTATGKYYIEARHKNGGGDNHLSVSWKLPDGTVESPIAGSHLSPADPVTVPEPKVTLSAMPSAAGVHRLSATVVSPTRTVVVPMLLTLPQNYEPAREYPLLVYLPDTDEEPDADGYRIQGPDRASPAIASIRAASPFITVTPQCPAGRTYDQRSTIKALSAAIARLAKSYPVARERIALTGANTGGTATWRLAMEKPGFYRALSAICGRQVVDNQLQPALQGTRVRIYTDIAKGFVTECANRIQESLAGVQPPSKVVYLGEKELGAGTAADYCYSQSDFYNLLFTDPAQTAAPKPPVAPDRRSFLASAIALTAAAALLAWRLLQQKRHLR